MAARTRTPAAERKAAAKAAAAAEKPEPLPRLTLPQIEAADDLKELEINVPEWGGSIKVRGLSKAQWEEYTQKEAPDDSHFLLATGIVEPAISLEEAEQMRQKSITAVGRVEGAILTVCGLGSTLEEIEARFLAGD